MEGFNISAQEKYINDDITVVFTPSSSVTKYEYVVYKDNNVVDQKTIKQKSATSILLNETGSYKIEVKTYDYYNRQTVINSGNYNIDKESPVISLNDSIIEMHTGDILKPLEGITVTDKISGNLIKQTKTNINELNLNKTGLKNLTYTVSDEAGNTASKSVPINVIQSNTSTLFVVQLSIICLLFIVAGLIVFYRRSMKLEKRITKYSVEPLKDNSLALFDSFFSFYNKQVKKIAKILSKAKIINKYAQRYEKYVFILNKSYKSGLEFVASKVLISFIFLFIAIFSKTIQYEILSIYEICFPFIIGFFMPDIVYISKYNIHRKKIENDLLQAIIIMNNAFKSGRSITQAILLVTTELEGSIAEEFKKINLELSFGLSIDVVFKRFSDRIKLEEVVYLTASLSILNKTGGNIIKVFSSIEKSLFDKKKLKLELASLTGSSKLIIYCLFCVPILFVIFVNAINPGYFTPFYTSKIGGILLAVIIILYILYIVCIKKIMKIRM